MILGVRLIIGVMVGVTGAVGVGVTVTAGLNTVNDNVSSQKL